MVHLRGGGEFRAKNVGDAWERQGWREMLKMERRDGNRCWDLVRIHPWRSRNETIASPKTVRCFTLPSALQFRRKLRFFNFFGSNQCNTLIISEKQIAFLSVLFA